ncbi:MFS transporter [Nocardioides maradonensis]
MTAAPVPATAGPRWLKRELDHYPKPAVRYTSLAVVVAATVVLYYQLYLTGGVAIHVMASLHMSFAPFVYLNVAALVLAAVAAEAAHVVDKYGRANVISIGMFVVSLLCIFGIPNASSKASFSIMFVLLNVCEGVILVATPAVVRDFSPQVGRASAMGFWTMGPVLGSVVVTIVVASGSDTQTWQDKFVVSGIVGLIVGVITLFGLKELPPSIRDQVMVDARDRALIEAKMKGIDVEESLQHPIRQMLKPDILLSGLAISLFLVFYIVLVAFGPTYFQIVFNYKEQDANRVLIAAWVANATGLVLFGFISDKLGVRKPFMLIGGVLSTIFMILFALEATHFGTEVLPFGGTPLFGKLAFLVAGALFFAGMAYVSWMASYTETVERRNPALTATGLAVWGLLIRALFAIAVVIMPAIINTATPIIDNPGGLTIDGGRGHTVGVMANGLDKRLTPAQNQQVELVLGASTGKLPTLSADQNKGVETVLAAAQGKIPTLTADQNKSVELVLGAAQGKLPTLSADQNKGVQTVLAAAQGKIPTLSAAENKAVATIIADPKAATSPSMASALKDPKVTGTLAAVKSAMGDATVAKTVAAVKSATADPAVEQTVGAVSTAMTDPKVAETVGAVSTAMTDPKVAANVEYVAENAPIVLPALAKAPKQWQNYWWLCVGGAVIFIPMIWLMAGYWDPRKAKAALREHDAAVAAELAKVKGA